MKTARVYGYDPETNTFTAHDINGNHIEGAGLLAALQQAEEERSNRMTVDAAMRAFDRERDLKLLQQRIFRIARYLRDHGDGIGY